MQMGAEGCRGLAALFSALTRILARESEGECPCWETEVEEAKDAYLRGDYVTLEEYLASRRGE